MERGAVQRLTNSDHLWNRGLLNGRGGLLRDRGECRRLAHSKVREDLAVDLDTGLVQAVDEAAVRRAVEPGRRVDARNPQLAEVALALAPVPVGIVEREQHGLVRPPEHTMPLALVARRHRDDLL